MEIIQLKIGGMAEWLKAMDCKSIGNSRIGSNPIPSKLNPNLWRFLFFCKENQPAWRNGRRPRLKI
jgi:hypothetical protein